MSKNCECCKQQTCDHCWHYQTKRSYDTNAIISALPYAEGGENRRCCHCGKFESDLHGPFAPKYGPTNSWGTTGTVTYYPNVTTPYTTWTTPNTAYGTGDITLTGNTLEGKGEVVLGDNGVISNCSLKNVQVTAAGNGATITNNAFTTDEDDSDCCDCPSCVTRHR